MFNADNHSTRTLISVGAGAKEQTQEFRPNVSDERRNVELRPNDVICAKGLTTQKHPGNVRYDAIIRSRRDHVVFGAISHA